MKYKLLQRNNPQDPSQSKWYAAPVSDGKVTRVDVAAEIVNISSLSRGDVSNVIECLIDVIPKYLLMGKSVSLGDLGTFRLSFSSDGVDNPAEMTVARIHGVRVLFVPSVNLKKTLDQIHFEKSE
ncbi:MAG: HU family DNA-binding protein [Tannerella sp.]|jgi:predicted histone-like DNA-binding protein|nr:HU family DNA-binding protein [Tannerella sp.]